MSHATRKTPVYTVRLVIYNRIIYDKSKRVHRAAFYLCYLPIPCVLLDVDKCLGVYCSLITLLYSQQTSILAKLQHDTNVISLQYRTKYFFYVYQVVKVNSTDETR